MTLSVSEYFRGIVERDELLALLKKPTLSKASREHLLGELRKVDKELGVDSGNYNSSDFGKVTK